MNAPETPQAPRPAPGTPQRGSVDGDSGEALREALAEALWKASRPVSDSWKTAHEKARRMFTSRAGELVPLVVAYGDQRAAEALREAVERIEAAKPSIPPSTDPTRQRALAARLAYNHAARLARADEIHGRQPL